MLKLYKVVDFWRKNLFHFLFYISQTITVNVVGHSNCPRNLQAPGYIFHAFTRPGAKLNDIYRYPLNQCLNQPADVVILFLTDNEFRDDKPKYILSKLKSVYKLIRHHVTPKILLVDALPRSLTYPSRATKTEHNRRERFRTVLKRYLRRFSIPFVPLSHDKYLPHLKTDGVHLTSLGQRLLREDIIQQLLTIL